MGLFDFLDELIKKLPIQDRKERIYNQIDDLTRERKSLLKGECDAKKSNRVAVIDRELERLNQLVRNFKD